MPGSLGLGVGTGVKFCCLEDVAGFGETGGGLGLEPSLLTGGLAIGVLLGGFVRGTSGLGLDDGWLISLCERKRKVKASYVVLYKMSICVHLHSPASSPHTSTPSPPPPHIHTHTSVLLPRT